MHEFPSRCPPSCFEICIGCYWWTRFDSATAANNRACSHAHSKSCAVYGRCCLLHLRFPPPESGIEWTLIQATPKLVQKRGWPLGTVPFRHINIIICVFFFSFFSSALPFLNLLMKHWMKCLLLSHCWPRGKGLCGCIAVLNVCDRSGASIAAASLLWHRGAQKCKLSAGALSSVWFNC